jgi:hypothetical protein
MRVARTEPTEARRSSAIQFPNGYVQRSSYAGKWLRCAYLWVFFVTRFGSIEPASTHTG